MYFAAALIASLVVSASSLATPHVEGLNRRHHHAALARRAPAPEPVAQPLDASAAVPKKQLKKRCKPRRTSSSLAPASTPAPVNVAPLPIIETTPPAAPSPSPSPPKAAPPPPKAAPPKAAPPPPPPPPPKPTNHPAPPAPPSSGGQSSSLFSGLQIGGDGTFYGTGLGACGITNKDTDFIAAAPFALFDSYPGYNGANPNQNPICGKKVRVEFEGKSVTVTITDRCEGCMNPRSLDMSPSAFQVLADPARGRISGIQYTWL